MKKFISAFLCFVFIFACMQLPVSAQVSSSEGSARLQYINDAQVTIGKSGSNVMVTGVLSCRRWAPSQKAQHAKGKSAPRAVREVWAPHAHRAVSKVETNRLC